MTVVANIFVLAFIASVFSIFFGSLFHKSKVEMATTFYDNGKMAPGGYLTIQRNLSKTYHSQP